MEDQRELIDILELLQKGIHILARRWKVLFCYEVLQGFCNKDLVKAGM